MKKGRMDFQLMILTICLVAFGLLMVFSSSFYYAMANFNNKMHFVIQDLRWVLLGFVIMCMASFVDYKLYKKLAPLILLVNFIFLIAVLLFGRNINGSTRWLYLGTHSFTPSEFSKAAMLIFTAFYFDKTFEAFNKPKILLIFVGILGLNSLLILKQPDMSTSVLIATSCMAIVFVAGLRWLYIIVGGGLGVGLLYYLSHSASYRLERVTNFLAPLEEKLWQIKQALFAIGTGGLTGVGLTQSTANKLYIPEPQNDFILATIGEEFGYFGMVLLLSGFLLLIYRCFKIAINAPDRFSSLLAFGIGALISIQVTMNYFVVASMMPVTGIPLPFISYGGNSKVIMLFLIGVVLNISKHSEI